MRPGSERLRRLTRALPRVLDSDDPKAVHRARVAARRVEEYLAALFPDPPTKKLRKFHKLLRNIRRDLGGWRNCDVVLSIVGKNKRRARNDGHESAWRLVEAYVEKERRREIKRARRRIDGLDIRGITDKWQDLLNSEKPKPADLQARLDTAAGKWQSSLTDAERTRCDSELHEFRIATKKLRYRLELAQELERDVAPLLETLKGLQRVLGKWHDHEIADRMIAESLARPKILLREFRAAQTLLKELEKDDRRQKAAAEEILRAARGAAGPAGASGRPPLLLAFSRP